LTQARPTPDGLPRRSFLQSAAAGVVLLGVPQVLLTAPNAAAAPLTPGYGPLVPDPAGRLALPRGFTYRIVTEAGKTTLESGEPTPGTHDGTGAFRSGRGTVLVNNHEIGPLTEALADGEVPVPHSPRLTYDPGMGGGCTVVETDGEGARVNEHVGIAGTSTNCAGGITPWSTWLTCEEDGTRAGEDGATKDHGYVFEVDPFDRGANIDPTPVKALGRYDHEAAAVDPDTCDLYLTEDASGPNGLFYRWTAPDGFRGGKGALRALGPADGVLAAMACTIDGEHVDDLARGVEIGTTYQVEWVPVPDRDAATVPTREQFGDDQVTRGRKIEGLWWGDGGAYVVTSFARAEDSPVPHDGQVWFYDPRASTLTLEVRLGVNPTPDVDGPFDGPDNITVSPWGGLILAEDGVGVQHLIGVSGKGDLFPMARNEVDGSEFTGPVYSHDKRVLFANVQTPGTMYAITGPWRPQH
jgi:secreted PhoX family phosphatase